MRTLNQCGATVTEYLVVLLLVACVLIAVVRVYGTTVEAKARWADERVHKYVTF